MSCETVQARAVVLGTRPGLVELAVTRQSACACCSEKCGSRDAPPRAQKIWMASERSYQTGEEIAIEVPQDQILRSALLVYGLPLTGFIAGMLAGIPLGEMAAILAALTGLVLGFAAASRQSRRWISPLKLLQGEKND
jgi:sigma-E factor negative regulatory protein RseC